MLAIIALIVILLHFSATVFIHIDKGGIEYSVKYLGIKLLPRKKNTASQDEQAQEETEEPESFDEELSDELDGLSELTDGSQDLPQENESPPDDTSEDISEPSDISPPQEDKPSGSTDEISDEKESDEKKPEKKKGLLDKIKALRTKYNKVKPYIPYAWKCFTKLLKTVRIQLDDVWIDVGRDDAHEAAIWYGSVQALLSSILMAVGGMFTLKVKKCRVECVFAQNKFSGAADLSVRVRPSAVIAILFCTCINFLIVFLKQKKAKKNT